MTAEWGPDASDAYRILIASNPFETTKELDNLHASFLTHKLYQALTAPSPEIVDRNGKIRINLLSKWIREEAERYNANEDSKKVAIPYLTGNDKYNFEIADVTPEEINGFKSLHEDSPLPNQCPIIKSSTNHSIQIEKKYMDQLTSNKNFDTSALNRFRHQLRDDTRESYPDNLSHEEFLTKANLLVNGYLTRSGVLLFGKNPIDSCRSAVTQCYKYYGTNKTARRDRKQISLTIPDQISASRDFIALNIKKAETPVADRAESQVEYEYPMICVREIIANALAHRDYEDNYRFVHVTQFSDRIEVSSPGNWFGKPLIDGKSYKLDELKSSSIKRNIALADVLSWVLLVEGEGSGILKAIEECQKKDSPIPDVVQKEGFVTVTIWPSRKFQISLDEANYSFLSMPHQIPLIPRQIPPPPSDFKGREEEIRDLLSNFDKGVTITGLRGMGGVGKSALAFMLAQKLKTNYPDGQLLINLQGTSMNPLSPAEAMGQVIRAYRPSEHLPENQSELRGLYHSTLAGKRTLMVLDNAAAREQIEPLLPPEGSAVIITSRNKFALPGLIEKDLDVLPQDKAVELLIEIAPHIGDRAEVLAKLCGYLPLALRNAASALAERRDLRVAEYEQRLKDKRVLLDLVGASLTLSYELLSPLRRKQWCHLSVFPEDFNREGAAAIWKMGRNPSAEALSDLVKWSLVDFMPYGDSEKGRYRLHDLARIFADSRLETSARDTTLKRYTKHYMNVLLKANNLYMKGGENILAGLELFDIEWPNIQAGQAWAEENLERDSLAAELCKSYPYAGVNILDLRVHPEKRIRWLEASIKAARALNDWLAEGNQLASLGRAYADLGETRKAIEYHEQALKIARETGNKRGDGAALGSLGRAYADLGETRKAIEYFEQALDIARETGNKRGDGAALGCLGGAYADLGKTRKAIEYFKQALPISREIGDRRGEGANLAGIGRAYADLGETQKAIEYFEQALSISRKTGDRMSEGANLVGIGRAHADLGETQKAIEYFEQALPISREIGDRRGEGANLAGIGRTYASLGETQKAIEYFEQALSISRKTGDRRGEGANLAGIGRTYASLGETQKAIEYFEQALSISRKTGDRRGEGANLAGIGRTYASLGETQKAIEYFEQALSISRKTGDRRGEGANLAGIGRAYADLGETRKAIEYFEQALVIERKIGDRMGEGNNLFNMSLAFDKLGERDRGIDSAKLALEIFEKIRSPKAEQMKHQLAERLGELIYR